MARVGPDDDGAVSSFDDLTGKCLFWIQPIEDLPRVDFSATIASCCWVSRAERRAFNSQLVAFTERWLTALQLVMIMSCPCMLVVFFVQSHAIQVAASAGAFCSAMPLLLVAFATLSTDMIKVVAGTFEFWFLTVVNVINTLIFFSLFRDLRFVGIIAASLFYQLTLFTDANLRTRLVELRFLVFGSPAVVVTTLACVLQITHRLHLTTFSILGASITDIDLLINGNFIIAFFTILKTHRNRHLLLAKHRQERHVVQCQMFFPVCHLVASSGRKVQQLRAKSELDGVAFARRKTMLQGTTIEYNQILHMVPSAVADAIDANDIMLKNDWVEKPWALNLVSFAGLACSTTAHIVSSIAASCPFPTAIEVVLEIVGITCTLLATVSYATAFQRDLLLMVAHEVDAWFSATHFTLVAVCVGDINHWSHRCVPLGAVWLWSVWIVLLDAVPPTARRRLGFQRRFGLLVNVAIMLFHASLIRVLYFQDQTATQLRNRVLVDVSVGSVHLRLEMFSFVTSKIFTSFVWMGRFLWRELFRPRDAFKLIKHRAQYLIPVG